MQSTAPAAFSSSSRDLKHPSSTGRIRAGKTAHTRTRARSEDAPGVKIKHIINHGQRPGTAPGREDGGFNHGAEAPAEAQTRQSK